MYGLRKGARSFGRRQRIYVDYPASAELGRAELMCFPSRGRGRHIIPGYCILLARV